MKLRQLLLSLGLAFSLSTAALAMGDIDTNTLTQTQLEMLSGVGSSTAATIIEHRSQIGRFGSVEELVKVNGIGDEKLAKLNQYLMATQLQPK